MDLLFAVVNLVRLAGSRSTTVLGAIWDEVKMEEGPSHSLEE